MVTDVVITLVSAAWLRINLRERGLKVWSLLLCDVLYAIYLTVTLSR